jgi:hypothetical protein
MEWTTRADPEHTRKYGVEEVHNAYFLPRSWPGKGPTFCLVIPECEVQFCFLAADGQPVGLINRPPTNKRVKGWVRTVCKEAKRYGAAVILSCDTQEQVERAAKQVAELLPGHERVSMERMQDPQARVRSNLN